MWNVHVEAIECSPRGMFNLMQDCKSNAGLAGTLYVIIGNKCPAGCLVGVMILQLSIYCVLLHTWLLQYVFPVTRAFLTLTGKNDKHNLFTVNKYYMAAAIYTL